MTPTLPDIRSVDRVPEPPKSGDLRPTADTVIGCLLTFEKPVRVKHAPDTKLASLVVAIHSAAKRRGLRVSVSDHGHQEVYVERKGVV
jgi:hypothetical protein